MKGNFGGLLMAGIIIFNVFCLLFYFLLKFWKHDRKLDDMKDENEVDLNEPL